MTASLIIELSDRLEIPRVSRGRLVITPVTERVMDSVCKAIGDSRSAAGFVRVAASGQR